MVGFFTVWSFHRTFDLAFGESVEISLNSVALVYISADFSIVLKCDTNRLLGSSSSIIDNLWWGIQ